MCPSRFENVDLVIVRENTEDLYAGLEHEIVPGIVESLKIITEKASTRIARFAFEHAKAFGRKRVTAIHKANIMKLSDGLFLESCRAVSREYLDITYDERIVDAACMHLVMHPEKLDVLLLPNLYGDIVSDLCAGLVGGLGVVPGANIGTAAAVFEAVHGSAPDIADQNLANPTALLMSGLLMLDYIGERARAGRIREGLHRVLASGHVRTRDLGGTATHHGVHRRGVPRSGKDDIVGTVLPDDITQAVLARKDVARYLRGGHGQSELEARERINGYLDELKTTQRYPIYRALKHPLYPILRKVERLEEHVDIAQQATRTGRVIYVSNHKSHLDYLVEPLVLDDNGIRPPVTAAGINLFGGPLGLLHRHVTGAIPIRRNTKDPAYLVTLKAYVAELLQRSDLLFYIEGGRSYTGELKAPKTGLLHAALQAQVHGAVIVPLAVAYDVVLEDHILPHAAAKRRSRPFGREVAEMVRYAVGYQTARLRHVRRPRSR